MKEASEKKVNTKISMFTHLSSGPDEAKHCVDDDVINGTPGSRTVARGSGRPVGLGLTIADIASLCPANTQPGEARNCAKSIKTRMSSVQIKRKEKLVLVRIYEDLGARPV